MQSEGKTNKTKAKPGNARVSPRWKPKMKAQDSPRQKSWTILGHVGAILGQSWDIFGPSRAILGQFWDRFGPSCDHLLGPSWGHLGNKSFFLETFVLTCLYRISRIFGHLWFLFSGPKIICLFNLLGSFFGLICCDDLDSFWSYFGHIF